jgi:mannose-6-phosphate isomerase class I
MARKPEIVDLIGKQNGVLRLRPTFVHRFYPDLNRLGQNSLKKNARQFIPERWIGSSVEAINPQPIPSGGLSMLTDDLSLRDAIKAAPDRMLSDELYRAHGAEFRVLVKILDPGEPIVFHLHATDAQVKKFPKNFKGHRFGKDEAYYFLEAPKGPMPYTHVGLYDGVTRRELVNAVRKGPQYALELSPVIYQHYEQGFFVPAGLPHRPGTALTLEIQQPSDVYTLLETHAGGKPMSAQQMHPGFKTLDEAFGLIDFKLAQQVGKLKANRLIPKAAQSKTRGGEIAWVFPPEICKKFGGKRIRVTRSLTVNENSPFTLWYWKGAGTLNGRKVRAGDEFFVTADAARNGIELTNATDELFEAFTFFPTV